MEQAELLVQMAEIQRLSGIQPKEAEAQQMRVSAVRVLVQEEVLLVLLRGTLLAEMEAPMVQTEVQHIIPAVLVRAPPQESLAKPLESFIPAAALEVAALSAERLITAVPVARAAAVTEVAVAIVRVPTLEWPGQLILVPVVVVEVRQRASARAVLVALAALASCA